MKCLVLFCALAALGATLDDSDLLKARDHQDRAALEKIAAEWRAGADKQPNDAAAQYRLALAESYSAEVAIEQPSTKVPACAFEPAPRTRLVKRTSVIALVAHA